MQLRLFIETCLKLLKFISDGYYISFKVVYKSGGWTAHTANRIDKRLMLCLWQRVDENVFLPETVLQAYIKRKYTFLIEIHTAYASL